MSIFAQLGVLFVVSLAAEAVSAILPFTFPATVLSMVVLLFLMFCKVIKPRQLQQTADFLLGNLTLFFVPACVGILQHVQIVLDNFWAIVGISMLTVPLVFFVTGHVVQLTMKLLRRRGGKNA